MYFTYTNVATSGSSPAIVIDGQATGDEMRVIKKILIGNPVASATLTLFNENNALANNTTQIAFALTLPAASGNTPISAPVIIDFTTNSNAQGGLPGSDGLQVRGGGSIVTSSAMGVTVLWDFANT